MYREPWQQLKWDSMSVVRVLQALIAPESKGERKAVATNIGGPVAIVMGLYHTVRGNMMDGFGFLRMICVNLAILNLLPFPVLDGGHIIFALFEIITRRKPHPKVVAVLVNAFAVLLIGLMALLVYTDISKKIKYNKAVRALEREEAAEAVTNAPAARP
jgi:regulator of sigma E protease